MSPKLERIVQQIADGDLPEIWRVPNIERFSPRKILYDYQQDALKKAARILCLYFGKTDSSLHSPSHRGLDSHRKFKTNLAQQYGLSFLHDLSVKKYERHVDKRNERQNAVYRVLSEFFPVSDEEIH